MQGIDAKRDGSRFYRRDNYKPANKSSYDEAEAYKPETEKGDSYEMTDSYKRESYSDVPKYTKLAYSNLN